ncbi:DUF4493 domain-containing protein [Phocaeicola coprophilus]|uniref:DUF4493 domain-containing protein n=1 Tax=Phocaeicola coprophilus TaxID=387090 RepID=UPI0022E17D0F|nr:DUF4493 domain-containing protein [Phocaeicola coprophilus]
MKTIRMNKNYLMLLALVALGLSACRSDERTPSGGGYLAVRVAADNEVVSAASRAEGDGIPDVGDFSLSIAKENGELVSKWDKFSDYDAEATVVPVGTYTVSASYGDATTEGFDGLSYAGSTTANVAEGETTDVTIDCTINKARVSISYTDAFKSYFTSYSAYVSSSRGNKIDYTADETRAAYFTPGNLDVYLNVTRPGVSGSVALKVKTLAAEVKHEYRLTMDVDAGTSTLNIIFNDDPESTQNVEFNISDAALNAPAPTIVAHGFTSGEAMEVVEGGSVEGTLQAYLNAPSGLASCELVTSSAALKAQGWPEKVDLMALSAEDQQKLTELGLVMKGLGSTHDKIATVEFQNVVPYLYCTGDGNEEHSFTLTATDVYGKTTETPLVLNVTSRNNGFAVTLPESVPYGSNTMSFTMNLEGDASKVKFYYYNLGAFQLFTSENVSISSEGTTHTVTLTYPDPLIDTESDVKFKAEYGSKTIEKTFKVEDPELTLSLKNGDVDVWATKAYVKVEASAKSRASRTISSSTVEIQYKDGEVWKVWPNQSYDSEKGLFLLTAMGEGATDTNGVAYTLRAAYKRSGEVVTYSGELPITTEAKTQIPNSGFDDWYTDSKEQWSVGLFKNIKWFFYYPFQQGDEGHWWSTNNERAQAWTVAPVYVTTCPAVIYTYDTRTGEGKAAEIHTSGSGGEYASTSTSMYPESAFAGSIFIGSYSWSDKSEHKSLGHSFNTRPLGLSFWYKYKPYKTDAFKVLVEVKSGETVIAAGEYVPEAYSSEDLEYQQHTISLEYTNSLLKATSISVQFLSTNKTSFTENDLQKNGTLTLTDCADSWNAHFGSFLKIDDVELIYE